MSPNSNTNAILLAVSILSMRTRDKAIIVMMMVKASLMLNWFCNTGGCFVCKEESHPAEREVKIKSFACRESNCVYIGSMDLLFEQRLWSTLRFSFVIKMKHVSNNTALGENTLNNDIIQMAYAGADEDHLNFTIMRSRFSAIQRHH